MNIEQGMQITDFVGFARRRGKLIAVIAGIVILATFWICMALPNQYTSSAMILVEPQSVDEDLVNSGVRESDLNERLGLMTAEILSRSRLSKIIDEVGLYKKESEDLQRSEIIDLMRSYVSVEPVLSELETENAPRYQEVSFNTFRIIFRNESATVARDVAQLIAKNFINANIDARTKITAKSLDFMEDEIGTLSVQIEKVEKAVAEVKEANPGRLPEDMVAYSSTHDCDTTAGWYRGLSREDRRRARELTGGRAGTIGFDLARVAFGTEARLAVTTAQDLLNLGRAARMNTPGTADGNWSWRLRRGELDARLARRTRGVLVETRRARH